MEIKMSLAINLTAITGTALLLMTSAVIGAPFTFQDAEFLPNEHEGLLAAKSFVATELTPGLPMNEAITRVQQAHASCETPAASSAIVKCGYFIQARPAGGDLGENLWTVRLVPGPDNTLQSASVEKSRVGMPGVE
jgi:hypothetical protein